MLFSKCQQHVYKEGHQLKWERSKTQGKILLWNPWVAWWSNVMAVGSGWVDEDV